MANTTPKKYPTIGCCGIDCGLCPRFYTEGSSRCPGCGGEGFEEVHPPCSFKTCCAGKHGLEACGECAEYPCPKYGDQLKIERDSFVTHKRILYNQERIKSHGIENFMLEQSRRISILQNMLASYDDGRSKSFYCLAAALLPPERLAGALAEISVDENKKKTAKALKSILQRYAEIEGIALSLDK